MKVNTVISYFILTIWGILLVMGVLTILSPEWLVKLSNPGKNVEAISIKNAGDNYLKSNMFNEAIQQYIKALKIVPDLKSAIANLAVAYQKTGNYSKSILSFNKLLNLNPEYPGIIYYNLGEVYEKTGQTDIALKNYLLAADTAVFPEKSYQKAGFIYMQQKDWNNAINNFKLAIENRRNIENAYKGMLLTKLKASSDTSDIYREIDNILSTKSYLSSLNVYDDKIFTELLSHDIDLAKTYNNVGYSLASLGKYSEALGYLKIALQIYPSYTEAKNNMNAVKSLLEEE